MTIDEIATELLRLRQESARIEAREKQLREEMESLLASTPEKRFNADGHDFTLVPSGISSHLNEDLLRETLASRGLSETEVEAILQAATKTSERDGYLRISGQG